MDRMHELFNRLAELSSEELVELNDLLHDAFDAARNVESRTAENVATMAQLRDQIVAVRAENDGRVSEEVGRNAAAAAIETDVYGEVEPEPEPPADAEAVPEPVAAAGRPARPSIATL